MRMKKSPVKQNQKSEKKLFNHFNLINRIKLR
jgi:hypothetical protein